MFSIGLHRHQRRPQRRRFGQEAAPMPAASRELVAEQFGRLCERGSRRLCAARIGNGQRLKENSVCRIEIFVIMGNGDNGYTTLF